MAPAGASATGATIINPKYSKQSLERIQALIAQGRDLPQSEINRWRERARLAISAIYGDPSPQIERFNEIRWTLSGWSDATPDSAWRDAERRGLSRAIDQLAAIAEDGDAHLGSLELPVTNVPGLHPWVADAAARLWNDGHHAQAVQAAAAAVETWLRTKLGLHAGSAAAIISRAFSPEPPKDASDPRLRFINVGPPGSDAWKNAHEGAGAFGRGCMMRIRNLYSHGSAAADSDEPLEALAALSLLARWIDDADVVAGDCATNAIDDRNP